jgi:outer membrane biosynthesis protein TonB
MTLARIRRRRRVPRVAAMIRRRSLVVAVGLALTATVGPAATARADQAPAGDSHAAASLTDGAVQVPVDDLAPLPEPPLPPEPPEPPVGPDDLAPTPDEPEPPLPPDPDPPVGPDDLANPTENPDPESDPDPEPPADDDQSIPTPDRVDTGLGGPAGQLRQPVLVLAAAATALAVLLLVLATRRRATSAPGSAR